MELCRYANKMFQNHMGRQQYPGQAKIFSARDVAHLRRIKNLPKQNSDFAQFGSMALHAGGIRYA